MRPYNLTDFSLKTGIQSVRFPHIVFPLPEPMPLRAIPCHSMPTLFFDYQLYMFVENFIGNEQNP